MPLHYPKPKWFRLLFHKPIALAEDHLMICLPEDHFVEIITLSMPKLCHLLQIGGEIQYLRIHSDIQRLRRATRSGHFYSLQIKNTKIKGPLVEYGFNILLQEKSTTKQNITL